MKASGPLDWERLRDDVAGAEGGMVPWKDELGTARSRFLVAAQGRPSRSTRKPLRKLAAALAFAFAACLALASFSLLRQRPEAPISFYAGAEHTALQVGAPLAATGSEPLVVLFSDGTRLSVGLASKARVASTSARGATVLLEEGSLSFGVVHRDATSWQVVAGPFTVHVTGTQFDVRWSVAEQTLTVDLREGSVMVSGPTLEPNGRRMLAGESLHVSVAPEHVDNARPLSSAPEQVSVLPAPRPDSAKSIPSETAGSRRGSWKQLAEEGQFAAALAAAEREGFDGVARRASPAELLLLGDTARFAGSPERSEQALLLVRARASGTHEAAMAAFRLGRLAHDQRRNNREAIRWFQSYLLEEPSGRLAREAAGRLLEAQREAGDVASARDSATTYLRKYPAGPYAGLARSVLNQ